MVQNQKTHPSIKIMPLTIVFLPVLPRLTATTPPKHLRALEVQDLLQPPDQLPLVPEIFLHQTGEARCTLQIQHTLQRHMLIM